jgi:hypothetical protein
LNSALKEANQQIKENAKLLELYKQEALENIHNHDILKIKSKVQEKCLNLILEPFVDQYIQYYKKSKSLQNKNREQKSNLHITIKDISTFLHTKYKIDTRAPNSQEIQKLIETQLQKNRSFSEQEIESILKANTIQMK